LYDFDDYYEGITPLYYFTFNFLRRTHNLKISKKNQYLKTLSDWLNNSRISFEIAHLRNQIKRITHVVDTDIIDEIFNDSKERLEQYHKEHIEYQKCIYCNSWFIGDLEESALMWKSYSEEGGIAVRTSFIKFRKMIESYFQAKNKFDPFQGVISVKAGKVKYRKYYLDNDWISDIQNGTPLGFFKHFSYQQEKEYRVLIETETLDVPNNFSPLLNPFYPLFNKFEIVLHPSSTWNDFEYLKNKFEYPRQLRASFSELFNIPNKNK